MKRPGYDMDDLDSNDFAAAAAADCRRALLQFLDGGAARWDAERLSRWLRQAYWRATSRAPREVRVVNRSSGIFVSTESVEDILVAARAEVQERLWQLVTESRCDFVWSCLHEGLIVPVSVGDAPCFVPCDRARVRLADRALSLLAADYTTRPWAYEGEISYEIDVGNLGRKTG
jgi:hypothetical protein